MEKLIITCLLQNKNGMTKAELRDRIRLEPSYVSGEKMPPWNKALSVLLAKPMFESSNHKWCLNTRVFLENKVKTSSSVVIKGPIGLKKHRI